MASTVPLSVVADPDEPGTAQVYVQASVGGRPYRFLLDTGAAVSRIADDVYTRSLNRSQSPHFTGWGVMGPAASLDRILVPDMQLGDLVVTEWSVEVGDNAAGPPCILGLDVLSGHRLDFRFGANTLTIDETDPASHTNALLTSSRGHPHVDVAWGSAKGLGIWDSGAGVTVVDRSFARKHPHLFLELRDSVGVDSDGNEAATPMVMMSGCRIGDREFSESIGALVDLAGIQPAGDPAFDVILGYPLISQADWSIDLRSNRWGYL